MVKVIMNKAIMFGLMAAVIVLTVFPATAQDAKTQPAPAQAQAQAKPTKKVTTPEIDQDKNGKVSLAESQKYAEKEFTVYDRNKDLAISLNEFQAPLEIIAKVKKYTPAQKTEQAKFISYGYTRMDGDKSGTVTKAEFMKDAERRHSAMDQNKDGEVTPDEVKSLQAKLNKLTTARKAAAPAKTE